MNLCLLAKRYNIRKVAICHQKVDQQNINGPITPLKLIIEGTGTLGSAIARRLLAHDEPVLVMTCTPAKAAALAIAGAEIVLGDLADRASLKEACQGTNTLIAA